MLVANVGSGVRNCFTFVACGPTKDPVKAKKALEDAGYEVYALIASNGDKEKEELDESAQYYELDNGVFVAMIEAFKGSESDGDFIFLYYFKDSKAADKFWDAGKEDIEAEVKYYEENGMEVLCKKSGSIVYVGTEQAIKDTK